MIRKYIYGLGMDNPVAMSRWYSGADHWYYYYADALGSIRLLTDAGGVMKESYTYDVSGQPRVMRSAGTDGNWLTEDVSTYASSFIMIGNPIMFTGRWWDSTTLLYYYRFRDYSPQLGRFCQTDPAGYIDTMNLYAYCANNPITWIDPWGLDKDQHNVSFEQTGFGNSETVVTDTNLSRQYVNSYNTLRGIENTIKTATWGIGVGIPLLEAHPVVGLVVGVAVGMASDLAYDLNTPNPQIGDTMQTTYTGCSPLPGVGWIIREEVVIEGKH